MSIFNFAEAKNTNIEAERVAQAPSATFSDVVSASFDNTLATRIVGAGLREEVNVRDARNKLYNDTMGSNLYKDAVAKYLPNVRTNIDYTDQVDAARDDVREAINKYVNDLKAEDPTKWGDLLDDTGIKEKALSNRKASVEKWEKVNLGYEDGAGKFMGSLLGGVGASFYDPVNLALSVGTLGMGTASTFLRTVAIEAGVNVAAEVATIPQQFKSAEELGYEYTNKDVAMDLLTAGVFGSIFAIPSGISGVRARRQQNLINLAKEAGDHELSRALDEVSKGRHTLSYDMSRQDFFMDSYTPQSLSRSGLDPEVNRILNDPNALVETGVTGGPSPKSIAKTKKDLRYYGLLDSQKKLEAEVDVINNRTSNKVKDLELNAKEKIKFEEARLIETTKDLPRAEKKVARSEKGKLARRNEINTQLDKDITEVRLEAGNQIAELQDKIKEFQFKRTGEIDFNKDLTVVERALRSRQPIDPSQLTLKDGHILSLNPKKVRDPLMRQNIEEFQADMDAPKANTAKGASGEAPKNVDPNAKVKLDKDLDGYTSIKDARVRNEEEILKRNSSRAFKEEELAKLNDEIPDDMKVFNDGETRSSYSQSDMESAAQIKKDFEEALELQKALDTCKLK